MVTFRHKLMDCFTRAAGVQPGIEPAIKLPNWCQELLTRVTPENSFLRQEFRRDLDFNLPLTLPYFIICYILT
jgi:hypothetical protein